jgi:hypothetical protein
MQVFSLLVHQSVAWSADRSFQAPMPSPTRFPPLGATCSGEADVPIERIQKSFWPPCSFFRVCIHDLVAHHSLVSRDPSEFRSNALARQMADYLQASHEINLTRGHARSSERFQCRLAIRKYEQAFFARVSQDLLPLRTSSRAIRYSTKFEQTEMNGRISFI